jgi:hypothetical protein
MGPSDIQGVAGDTGYSPAANFSGDAGAGYVTPNGTFIAAGFVGGLLSPPLLRPPNVMEDGGVLDDGSTVWTGVNLDGVPAGFDCYGWTSDDSMAVGGFGVPADTDLQWTAMTAPAPCDVLRHIYCVEQ